MKKISLPLYLTKIFLITIVLFGVMAPQFALAWNWGGNRNWGEQAGLPTEDLRYTVLNIVRWALALTALIAVIVIIIAGIQWMISGGNEEQITKAKKMIQAAIIGIIIISLAWAITIFVISAIEAGTSPVT